MHTQSVATLTTEALILLMMMMKAVDSALSF